MSTFKHSQRHNGPKGWVLLEGSKAQQTQGLSNCLKVLSSFYRNSKPDMVWHDHVFNFGPKSATRVAKLRSKHPRQWSKTVSLKIFQNNATFPKISLIFRENSAPPLFSQFVTAVVDFGPWSKTWSRQIMFYTVILYTYTVFLQLWDFLKRLKLVIWRAEQ